VVNVVNTGLLVMSNKSIHFVKYLLHVTFTIQPLVLLFRIWKLPASHPVPNTGNAYKFFEF
jgi:hypothetical protein